MNNTKKHTVPPQLEEFLNQPGINKSGICNESNIHPRYMEMFLDGTRRLTPASKAKLLPTLEKHKEKLQGLIDLCIKNI